MRQDDTACKTLEDRVNEAIAEYLQTIERGEIVDVEQFLVRHDDIRSELDSFIANQSSVQQRLGALAQKSAHGRFDSVNESNTASDRDPLPGQPKDADTQLIMLLDAAIDDIRSGTTVEIEEWSRIHPEFGARGAQLLQTVQDLALAADDWRHAARTIVGTEILDPNRLTPNRNEDDTLVTSQCGDQSASDLNCERRKLPERFGRYEIVSWIGSGSMGDVYRAHDPQLQRPVAVKVPKFEGRSSKRAEFIERFLREARTAAAIRHPHICPIYDTGEQDGTLFVVMAFVNGESLAERLRRKGRYQDPREAVTLAADIAEALDEVHRHGVIHRDLKPGNILLDLSGNALLTDFGLARSFVDDEHLTAVGVLVGTPAYMSPEQTLDGGKGVGPATDLYGLGMVLFEMLTGRLPFTGGTVSAIINKVTQSTIASPASFRPDLNPQLVAIVERAIQHAPEKRFPNARAFADAMRDWLESEPYSASNSNSVAAMASAAPPVPTPLKAPVGFRSRRWFLAASCLIAVPIVCLAILSKGTESRGLPPLSGHLKLRFISDPQPGSNKASARPSKEGDAAPLFNGQKVQLETQLNRPGYIYVIWIDSDGAAEPIYPWDYERSKKLWNAPIQERSHRAAEFIPCPEKPRDAFRATGKPGFQHVFLLARATPLKSANLLLPVFSDLPASPLTEDQTAAMYVDWSPSSGNRMGLLRGLEAGATYDTGDVEELEPTSEFDESDIPMFHVVKARLNQHDLGFELIKVWRFAQKDES